MRVHFLKNENNNIAFFPDSKRFFRVNDLGKKLIQMIVDGTLDNDILSECSIDQETLNTYKDKVNNYAEALVYDEKVNTDKKVLQRLVIHISNACNLRCIYCYANGGNYKSENDILSKEVADKIIETFYSHFDEIKTIQLFGGEPLVSMDMIEYVCNKVRHIDKDRNTDTRIGIVTNGTLIDDRFIGIVKKYNLNITVSYDGDFKVNNITRKFANGEGSSSVTLKKIKRLKEETNQPSTIEATYTRYHIDNNISVMDVINHISTEVPQTSIHLVPAGGSSDSYFVLDDYNEFVKSVDEVFKKDNSPSYTFVERIVRALSNKMPGSPYICDAGVGTLSVSVKGDIYPCFMFTDDEELILGSVFDKGVFKSKKLVQVLKTVENFNIKKNNSDCKDCFANNICTGCLGLNQISTGSLYELDKKYCEMTKKMVEIVLVNLATKIDKSIEKRQV